MKRSKKILSLMFCFVMAFAVAMPAFASAESIQCPTIYIPGIASSYVYADKDDTSEYIDVPDKETLTAALQNEIAPALLVYAADGNVDKLAHKVSAVANELLADWFNNPDGTPKGNSGVNNYYPSRITKNSRLAFYYDWRGDPFVLASQLNDYISYVTEKSGCDKVALTSHSMGSIVILTYLSVYGDDKVAGIVLDTPAIEGVAYAGELLCGKAEITAEAVSTFFKGVVGVTDYDEIVSSSLDILEMAGVSELATGFLDDVMKKIGPVFFRETLVPLFGSWLTIWAMCPEEKVEQAIEVVFGDTTDEDGLALKEKIVNYNELVRKDRKDTLLNFDDHGRIAIISRYGYSSLPITSSWALLGDSVIETQSSSLGATTAIPGDYFSDEYLEGKDMKYISPDKTVDASTCLFPEKTWFIKNILHIEASETIRLHNQLLFGEEEATCDNYQLQRFTLYDYDTDTFNPDNTVPVKAEKLSPLQRLFNFLKAFFDKLISYFTNKK